MRYKEEIQGKKIRESSGDREEVLFEAKGKELFHLNVREAR